MSCRLSDIATYVNERVSISKLTLKTYVSTENMIPNKGGITVSSGLPAISTTQAFKQGDVLVSNIRPYFKKIWVAEYDGGCSNDVLVFRPKEGIASSEFLYLVLSDDAFFDYMMAGSKGTKMPRGDRKAIIDYPISDFAISHQDQITRILLPLNRKIHVNAKLNDNLQQQAVALFKSYFIDFEFALNQEYVESEIGLIPRGWRVYKLSEFLPVITGRKNVNITSAKGKYPFFSCSQDFLWTNEYSFEGNAILVAGNGDFNVKWFNGKFEAYQRTYVLIPYVERFTSWLYYAVKYNLANITCAARGSVIKFITKGNLENFTFAAPKDLTHLDVIDVFDSINRTIDGLVQENYRLSALRDTLLPKLLSGEIDMSNVCL